jgi:hypothetical protein
MSETLGTAFQNGDSAHAAFENDRNTRFFKGMSEKIDHLRGLSLVLARIARRRELRKFPFLLFVRESRMQSEGVMAGRKNVDF